MDESVRMRCYTGNGTGVEPKRFTCYRGDRVGYTDECMKAYDEFRQVALDKLMHYEDTECTPEEIENLKRIEKYVKDPAKVAENVKAETE